MSWTDERINALKSLWAQGATAREIANVLGDTSRNAVLGKARRMGLATDRPVSIVKSGQIAAYTHAEAVKAADISGNKSELANDHPQRIDKRTQKRLEKKEKKRLARELAEQGRVARIAKFTVSLGKRSDRELRQIWLNLLDKLSSVKSADAELSEIQSALSIEWGKRTQYAVEAEGSFAWPSTDAFHGDGSLTSQKWPVEGMLAYMGYHAGITNGLKSQQRKKILGVVFASNLPPLNGRDYMKAWGEPSSPLRLNKLADVLASLCRNAKRKQTGNMGIAICDWEDDLKYLFNQYYVAKFGFGWPST